MTTSRVRPLHFIGLVDSPAGFWQPGQVVMTPDLITKGYAAFMRERVAAMPAGHDPVIHMPEAAIKGQPYAGRTFFDAPREAREYFCSDEFHQVCGENVWFYLGQPAKWSVEELLVLVLPWAAATGVNRFIIDASSRHTAVLSAAMDRLPWLTLAAEAFPLLGNAKPHAINAIGAQQARSCCALSLARKLGLAGWKVPAGAVMDLIVHHNDKLTADEAAELVERGFTIGSHTTGSKVVAAALGPNHAPAPDQDPTLPPVLPPPATENGGSVPISRDVLVGEAFAAIAEDKAVSDQTRKAAAIAAAAMKGE